MSEKVLTAHEAVTQRQKTHPEWTADQHLDSLKRRGFDLSKIAEEAGYVASPWYIVSKWLAEARGHGNLGSAGLIAGLSNQD